MAPKRSEVWLHFTVIDERKARCDLCKNNFSYQGGGTTNLKRHLESRHPTVVQKCSNRNTPISRPAICSSSENGSALSISNSVMLSTTQPLIVERSTEIFPPNPGPSSITTGRLNLQQATLTRYVTRPASVSRQKRLNNELLKFIIKDFQPFSIVDDQGFQSYCKALDPTYQLPSRSMLTKSLLPQHYDTCLNNVKQFINQAGSIAITTDTWTSRNTDNFMAITAHVITDEWQMGSVLLDCVDVSSARHTAEFLKEALLQCVQELGIEKKICAVVTDNAANISAAVRLSKYEHVRCFAHSLNLIVQDGIKEIAQIQKKVKCIVDYFHRSTLANKKLMQLQTQLSGTTTPLKLINDVVTRWNSTFHMLERFCQLQEPIEVALTMLHAEQIEILSPAEVMGLKEICNILKPFDGLTAELSAEQTVTISKILVLVEGVKHYLENLSITSSTAAELLGVIKYKISERFQNAESNYILQCSTYLDPRFKGKLFSDSTRKQVKDRLIRLTSELIQKETHSEDSTVPQTDVTKETPSFWSFFDSQNPAQTKSSPTAMAIIELRQYTEEALMPRRDDPLTWWQRRSLSYPHLSIIAKRLLAIPASSVSSERIFSKTGIILSERRNRLKPKNLKKIVFLNANFKFCE